MSASEEVIIALKVIGNKAAQRAIQENREAFEDLNEEIAANDKAVAHNEKISKNANETRQETNKIMADNQKQIDKVARAYNKLTAVEKQNLRYQRKIGMAVGETFSGKAANAFFKGLDDFEKGLEKHNRNMLNEQKRADRERLKEQRDAQRKLDKDRRDAEKKARDLEKKINADRRQSEREEAKKVREAEKTQNAIRRASAAARMQLERETNDAYSNMVRRFNYVNNVKEKKTKADLINWYADFRRRYQDIMDANNGFETDKMRVHFENMVALYRKHYTQIEQDTTSHYNALNANFVQGIGSAVDTVTTGTRRMGSALNIGSWLRPAAITAAVFVVADAIAVLVQGLTALGAGAIAAVQGLSPLLGLAGALPNVILLAAQSMSVFKMAGLGLSKALGGDADALASLGPEATELVNTLNSLRVEWNRIQDQVQENVWRGMAVELQNLSDKYFPAVAEALTFMGDRLNETMIGLSQWLQTSQGSGAVVKILTANMTAFQNVMDAANRLFQSFIMIASYGSPTLVEMSNDVRALSDRFDTFVKGSGASITEWIAEGYHALKRVIGMVVLFGRSFRRVFQASDGLARDLANSLQEVGDELNTWTGDATNMRKMEAWFTAMGAPLKAMGNLLVAIGKEMARIAATPGFAKTINLIATDLVPALGQIIEASSGEFLPALIGVVSALGKAAKDGLFKDLGDVFDNISKVLQNIIGFVGGLDGNLVKAGFSLALFGGLAFRALGFFQGMGVALKGMRGGLKSVTDLMGGKKAAKAQGKLDTAAEAAANGIVVPTGGEKKGKARRSAGQADRGGFMPKDTGKSAKRGIPLEDAGTKIGKLKDIGAAALAFVNFEGIVGRVAALFASGGPWGIVIAAVVALGSAFVVMNSKVGTFKTFMEAVGTALVIAWQTQIAPALKGAFDTLKNSFGFLIQAFTGGKEKTLDWTRAIPVVVAAIQIWAGYISLVIKLVAGLISVLVRIAAIIVTTVVSAFKVAWSIIKLVVAVFRLLGAAAGAAVRLIISGLDKLTGGALSRFGQGVQDVMGKVIGWFKRAGDSKGLIRIKNGWDAIASAVRGAADWISTAIDRVTTFINKGTSWLDILPGNYDGGVVMAGDRSLVGEFGPEATVSRSGKIGMVGLNGPEIFKATGDTAIIPSSATFNPVDGNYGNAPGWAKNALQASLVQAAPSQGGSVPGNAPQSQDVFSPSITIQTMNVSNGMDLEYELNRIIANMERDRRERR